MDLVFLIPTFYRMLNDRLVIATELRFGINIRIDTHISRGGKLARHLP